MLAMAGTLAGLLLGVASGDANTLKASQALMIGSRGAATAAMLNYSQDDEREADHVGMNALVKAGYNPRGMPETFEVMLKTNGSTPARRCRPTFQLTPALLTESFT